MYSFTELAARLRHGVPIGDGYRVTLLDRDLFRVWRDGYTVEVVAELMGAGGFHRHVYTKLPGFWLPPHQETSLDETTQHRIISLLKDHLESVGDDGRVTPGIHANPAIKSRIDAWLASKAAARGAGSSDQRIQDLNFLSFLKSTCQSDITVAQQHLTYDYFQRQLAEQQRERTELAGIFGEVIENAGRGR
jgi:hypothetical protein